MKLKQREKTLIYIGILSLVSWALYSYAYIPKQSEAKRLKQEIALAEESIQTNREIIQNSKLLEAEIEQLQNELASLKLTMGGGRQMFQILEQLEKEPYKTNIKLVSILPRAEETSFGSPGLTDPSQAVYTKLSIEMNLECQYYVIGPYLESLKSLPMLITIDKVSIEGKDEIYPNLAVNILVNTYTLSKQTVKVSEVSGGHPSPEVKKQQHH